MQRRKKIRIVVVGDEKVGKTSFIASLISEIHQKQLEKVIGPVILPPDMFNYFDCTTVLIDTSSDPNDFGIVENEIDQADVILLMYDMSRIESADKVGIYWMPRIKKINDKIPVIIVANKLDLANQDDQEMQKIFKVIKPLIKHFNQVEMGIECSVHQGKSIADIIHCCQRAYLFPLGPLYNLSEKQLTVGFKKALTRIFRICDKDNDGVWNDKELRTFQQMVFKRDLDNGDIQGIKEMINEELKDNSNENNITLDGFIGLQKRGVELMKIQICWNILRYFEYQDDLKLDSNLFKNELFIDQKGGQIVELSQKSLDFIKDIYKRFVDNNNLLNVNRLQDIFYPCEDINIWQNIDERIELKQQQYIELEQWHGLWSAEVYFDYMKTYQILKYIGYDGTLTDCYTLSSKKDSLFQLSKLSMRNIFHCAIIVPPILQSTNTQNILSKFINHDTTQDWIITKFQFHKTTKTIIWSILKSQSISLLLKPDAYQILDFIAIPDNFELNLTFPFPIFQYQSPGGALSIPNTLNDSNLQEFTNVIIKLIEKPVLGLQEQHLNLLRKADSIFEKYSTILGLGTCLMLSTVTILVWKYQKKIFK